MIMNKIMFGAIFGIGLFFMSCDSKSVGDDQQKLPIKYNDIDLHDLTGIGRVDDGMYPFVSIDSVGINIKKITLCYSKSNQETDTFRRSNFDWFRTYTTSVDTGMSTVVEIIHGGKIIWLEYVGEDTSSMKMYDMTIFDKDKLFIYSLKDPMKERFGILDSSILEKPMSNVIERNYDTANGRLSEVTINHDYINNDIKKDTICYELGAHSISWWIFFRNLTSSSSLECKCH